MPEEKYDLQGIILNPDGTVYEPQGIEDGISDKIPERLEGIADSPIFDPSVFHSIETPGGTSTLQETIESIGVPDHDEYSQSIWHKMADHPLATSTGLGLAVVVAYTSAAIYLARRRERKQKKEKLLRQASLYLAREAESLSNQHPRGEPVFLKIWEDWTMGGVIQRLYPGLDDPDHSICRVELIDDHILPDLEHEIMQRVPREIFYPSSNMLPGQLYGLKGTILSSLTENQRATVEKEPVAITAGRGYSIVIDGGALTLMPDHTEIPVN